MSRLSRPVVVAGSLVLVLWLAIPGLLIYEFGRPSDAGTFGDVFGAVTALFTGLTVVGLIYTLRQQHRQLEIMAREFLADHERRKLDATIHAIDDARRPLKDFALFLDSITGYRLNLNAEHTARIKNDAELRAKLHDGLEHIEGVALALNLGLYDDEYVFRLTGPFLTNLWARCEAYVLNFRHEWPTVCVEFQKLTTRYRDRLTKQYEAGVPRHLP